jgi:DNA mismatch endonuclease, patch repair protein
LADRRTIIPENAHGITACFPEKGMSRKRPSPCFKGLHAASEAASRAKRANRKKDTAHEVALRRALWKLGLRYRKHLTGLPGNPDLVFTAARVVVFCDGDFWHGREWRRLKLRLKGKHNAAYWVAKISRNRERDREQTAQLQAAGWLVLRFWESDILGNPEAAADCVARIVRGRGWRSPTVALD